MQGYCAGNDQRSFFELRSSIAAGGYMVKPYRWVMLSAGVVVLLATAAAAQQIPARTILPVMLNTTLDVRHDQTSKIVSATLKQNVALPDGGVLRKGAKVYGEVVGSTAATPGSPATLAIRFDQITTKTGKMGIVTELRALGSMNEVFQAKLPTNAIDDYGTSPSDWVTNQIGGAGVFRGNGEVMEYGEVVGRATDYGAVTAKLIASPQRGCNSNGEHEQSLWVFSPSACGVYGYDDLVIVRGDKVPPGTIELQSSRDFIIRGGSGLLLRVISAPSS